MIKITLLLSMLAFTFMSKAQIETPAASPASSVKQTVGLTEITVDYSRPSMKGREIFGNLVPYDQVWRTGANGSTDITFSEPVVFGGTEVEAGTYALYSIPGKNQWDVMLYKDASIWGAPKEIDQNMVVASTSVTPLIFPEEMAVETFLIGFDGLTNNGADLYLLWESTYVAVPIEVNTTSAVKESIQKTMAGPSANDYFAAARYYFEEDMDINQAYEWIQKATEMRPDAFWMSKVQAEIEASMGNYKKAMATAKQSMKVAKKAGNDQYIMFNEKNIAMWKKM